MQLSADLQEQVEDQKSNAFHFQHRTQVTQGRSHSHTNTHLEAPSSAISGPTHLENIKGIVPWGPETICTPPPRTWLFPKRNPFLIASLWALWGLTWNESNLQPWCSCFVLYSRQDESAPSELRGSSTTMWIYAGCICSSLHCREMNMYTVWGVHSSALDTQTITKNPNKQDF